MPVLGRAIANYLSRLGGLYSVELPESLSAEVEELVLRANHRARSGRVRFVFDASHVTGRYEYDLAGDSRMANHR